VYNIWGGSVSERAKKISVLVMIRSIPVVFLGFDKFLGPIFLGYGLAENDKHSVYFYLGKMFKPNF
jgi:hypothetical protein